jgi:hypothetical protein
MRLPSRFFHILTAAIVLAASAAFAQEHFNLNNATRYSGRAIAFQIKQTALTNHSAFIVLSDSGISPTAGGQVQNYLAEAAGISNVAAQSLTAITSGDNGQSRSRSSVTHLDVTLGSHHITALWVESKARAIFTGNMILTVGKSQVEGLVIDGTAVDINGIPNQTINFPDGYLVIDEQTGSHTAHFGSLTVTALHLVVPGAGELIVANSKAELVYAPQNETP